MPFPFALPTTSSVQLSDFFSSDSHPSLVLAATTRRTVLKDALKKHKRLGALARVTHLAVVQNAIVDYLPYLLTLSEALASPDASDKRVKVRIVKPLEVEWRATISASLPGREPPRRKLTGIHNELVFTLSTLAYVHSLLARARLKTLYDSSVKTADQRASAVSATMKHYLEAHSIHKYILSLHTTLAAKDGPPDIQSTTIYGLASLALAEATIVVVQKDDPYSLAVADERNENVTDWMFKGPSIPKVRTHLFARICLHAAETAREASSLFAQNTVGKIDETLVKYADDLGRTAKAKAARFLGIDAELEGHTGEALAWIKGAKNELGLPIETDGGKRKGLQGFKQSWRERREDKKIERGAEWGFDANRLEEVRILEMLEAKWEKQNSMVNVQTVPPWEPQFARLPTGREYHRPQPYEPPVLGASKLEEMRAPPDPAGHAISSEEDDSEIEEGAPAQSPSDTNPEASSSTYY